MQNVRAGVSCASAPAAAHARRVACAAIALVLAYCAVVLWNAPDALAAKLAVSAPSSVVEGGSCRVTVRPVGRVRGKAALTEKRGRAWKTIATAKLRRPSVRLRCVTSGRAGRTLRLRVVVTRGGKKRMHSRRFAIRVLHRAPAATGPAPAPLPGPPAGVGGQPATAGGGGAPAPSPADPEFVVPPTTRVYDSGAISAAQPGAAHDQAVIKLKPGEPEPIVGGHVALGPTSGLPFGMFAVVRETTPSADGTAAVVEAAPIDEVLDAVDYEFGGPVTPRLVDSSGAEVPGSRARDGSLVIRGKAAPGGAFRCKNKSGVTVDQTAVWGTDRSLPIELKLENTNVHHRFDAGGLFPRRDPYLLLQFSGEAVAGVGFEAKLGFECQLTDDFRRNHRIQLPLRNIGPVPVTIYLEPILKFSVSASGKVSLSRRHYFAYTLEKVGTAPLEFRRAGSADPPEFNASARLDANLFVGGDLSLMVGAGSGSTSIGAGIYGGFGPELTLAGSTSTGCLTASARFRADLGARLNVWTKRWDYEFASLTSPALALPGSPFCGLPAPATEPDPDPGPRSTAVDLPPSCDPVSPALSSDGSTVVFNCGRDVFASAASGAGDAEPVSNPATERDCWTPTPSRTGRFVAMRCWHRDTAYVVRIDRHTGERKRRVANLCSISTGPDRMSVSADGSHVLYSACEGEGNYYRPDAMLWDVAAGTAEQANVGADGGADECPVAGSVMSEDARYVAFISCDNTLVAGDRDHWAGDESDWSNDIFLRDRVDGTTTIITSPDHPGEAYGYTSGRVFISPNGRFVVYKTWESVGAGGDFVWRLADTVSAASERVAVGAGERAGVSDDGTVAYDHDPDYGTPENPNSSWVKPRGATAVQISESHPSVGMSTISVDGRVAMYAQDGGLFAESRHDGSWAP